MFDQHESAPPVGVNASGNELREYFSSILPDHDRDRVHINDIKKCIKWYTFMYDKGILAAAKAEASVADTVVAEEVEEVSEQPAPEAKPKAAKKSAKVKS
jgi:hypothetical protein